jgi:hypothetical protein
LRRERQGRRIKAGGISEWPNDNHRLQPTFATKSANKRHQPEIKKAHFTGGGLAQDAWARGSASISPVSKRSSKDIKSKSASIRLGEVPEWSGMRSRQEATP